MRAPMWRASFSRMLTHLRADDLVSTRGWVRCRYCVRSVICHTLSAEAVEELGVRKGTRNSSRGWQAALPYLEAPGGTHVPAAASTAPPPSYMTPSADTDTRAGPLNVSSWLAL